MASAMVIRHVAFEDLGLLEPLLTERGMAFRYLEAGLDELGGAALRTADLLIVLGGPIGVYQEAAYPFLTGELAAIESWLAAEKPILGICLGAQLIARALGMRVFTNREKEIGISPVTLSAAGYDSPLRGLSAAEHHVLHWHGDTFDLPPQAQLLASTPVTTNQAFRIGDRALGLQFHLETRLSTLERWLIGHACELGAAGLDVARLRADAQRHAAPMETAGRHVLGEWLDRARMRSR